MCNVKTMNIQQNFLLNCVGGKVFKSLRCCTRLFNNFSTAPIPNGWHFAIATLQLAYAPCTQHWHQLQHRDRSWHVPQFRLALRQRAKLAWHRGCCSVVLSGCMWLTSQAMSPLWKVSGALEKEKPHGILCPHWRKHFLHTWKKEKKGGTWAVFINRLFRQAYQ